MSPLSRAGFLSLLIHGYVLTLLAILPDEAADSPAPNTTTAFLAQLRYAQPSPEPVPETFKEASPTPPREPIPVLKTAKAPVPLPMRAEEPPVAPAAVAAVANEPPRRAPEKPLTPMLPAATSGTSVEAPKARAVAVNEPVSADGIRQYRLNLAREARRYRRFPQIARASGWEGQVVIVVSTVAGSSVPVATISQGSGRLALDDAALEMLTQAIRSAEIPESLRHREYAFTLPVQFSLED